jgi:hypothetical protein
MCLSSEPQLECGDPGSRTWQPIAGCLGGRGQHPANADGHFAAGEGPAMECTRGQVRRRVNSRLLPCWCPFRTRDRTARVGHHCSNRQGGEALPRPRCWRPARRVQPQRGHLCGWPEHNYCARNYPHDWAQISAVSCRNGSETVIETAHNSPTTRNRFKAPCWGQHTQISCFACPYLTTNSVP